MINIGNYSFEGPYSNTDLLQDCSGIYAILDRGTDGQYTVIDIGESAEVKTRVETHDRKLCWTHNANGVLNVAVMYTPTLSEQGRR